MDDQRDYAEEQWQRDEAKREGLAELEAVRAEQIIIAYPYVCSYCEGWVVWSDERQRYEHAEDGERVDTSAPGDFASAAHNKAGTPVNSADVLDRIEYERIERESEPDLNNDNDGFGNTFRDREYPSV